MGFFCMRSRRELYGICWRNADNRDASAPLTSQFAKRSVKTAESAENVEKITRGELKIEIHCFQRKFRRYQANLFHLKGRPVINWEFIVLYGFELWLANFLCEQRNQLKSRGTCVPLLFSGRLHRHFLLYFVHSFSCTALGLCLFDARA